MSDSPPDDVPDKADELAEALADSGAIGRRQAQAYVLRDIYGIGRNATAEQLGISPNTVDNHLDAARTNIEQARELVDVLEQAPPVQDT